MEAKSLDIRQQFRAIADSRFPLLLRKAVLTVEKGKFMFFTKQLHQIVSSQQ